MASAACRRRLRAPSLVTLAAPLLGLLLVVPAVAASACYDFTYEEPANEAGADAPSGASPDACVAGGAYCGGDRVVGAADTLYRCVADGGSTLLKKCASRCIRDAGQGDGALCAPPATACKVGGAYCGGDKLDGDPSILYRCVASGAPTILERCAHGCRVMASGVDDACAP